MDNLNFRNGCQSDKDWLYDLYCQTMRPFVEATWGWNEEFQKNGFSSNMKPESFLIIVFDGKDIGGFSLKDKENHLYLEMILIEPNFQKNGWGKLAMNHITELAQKKCFPLKLSVLKKNPVKTFYEKLGFSLYDEDEAFYRMQWNSYRVSRPHQTGGKP